MRTIRVLAFAVSVVSSGCATTGEPTAFEFSAGSFFGANTAVKWTDGALHVWEDPPGVHSLQPAERTIKPTQEQWNEFWRTLDEEDVWSWAPFYGYSMPDAPGWGLRIEVGSHRLQSYGINDFPHRWNQFVAALSRLGGGIVIDP
jgi:hypothetical protein